MAERPRQRWRMMAALALCCTLPAGAAVPAERLLAEAQAALDRRDGIAAEMVLRKALAEGASRGQVARRMGEAFMQQGDPVKARQWLAPGAFAPADAVSGFRALGRLELGEHNLPAAGRALDKALALDPDDGWTWLDIARLRYTGGEELTALAAADRAARLDPGNLRALELRGLMVRDQFGMAAALPWFEAGLKQRPDDLALLAEYAATLGEMGRAREMLVVTRQILALDPGNARAYFMQAVMAARAGQVGLARRLMNRVAPGYAATPAALLLRGVLELQAGNANTAVEVLDELSRRQPGNTRAGLLLARALYLSGDTAQLLERFGPQAVGPDASPYLLTLLGRACEDRGDRNAAAAYLDRAARGGTPAFTIPAASSGAPTPRVAELRGLLAAGRSADAIGLAVRLAAAAPASAAARWSEGDARYAAGDLRGAVNSWRAAASVRLSDAMLVRLVAAYAQAGAANEARALVATVLTNSPRNRTARRLAAGLAGGAGDWRGAAIQLGYLSRTGSAGDPRVQADLALAALRSGDRPGAQAAAAAAWALQRAAPESARARVLVAGPAVAGGS